MEMENTDRNSTHYEGIDGDAALPVE